MTMRERMLAVIQGRPHDRVPFVQYSGIAAPDSEVWSVIGRGNMGLLRWSALHRTDCPNCRWETEHIEHNGRPGFRSTLTTPEGSLTEDKLIEPAFGTAATSKHFVMEPDDYRVLASFLRDAVVYPHTADYENALRDLGDDGLPMASVNRTPFQQLWIQWVSLEDLAWHLAEHPDLVEECISLMADIQRRTFTAVCECLDRVPVSFVNVPDNITAPAIGPRYFEKYCIPLYREFADMLAERDMPVFVHMDGDLKPLWKLIGESGVRGLDSFSPPPDNDTSVADAVAMWPDMRLFANFPSSVHLAEPGAIYERAARMLSEAEGTGRLQIQISENVPRGVWRKSFPQIVKAIDDFAART